MKKIEIEELNKIIKKALLNLFIHDNYLLKNDGSERAIAHCLAIHLKNEYPEFNVDCEYNLNYENDSFRKEINLTSADLEQFNKKQHGVAFNYEDQDYYSISVYPDIIVHKRGSNTKNHIIFELKKSTSYVSPDYDFKKLSEYTNNFKPNGLRYKYGCFIKIYTELQHGYKYEVDIYSKSKKISSFEMSGGEYAKFEVEG